MSRYSISAGIESTLPETTYSPSDDSLNSYDVIIQFHSAEGIPKMDIIGHADPYFVAKIDDQITFTSVIIPNTGTPQWDDEIWTVRNIPFHAKLFVSIYDKDDEKLHDDYIGEFKVMDLINYEAPPNGHEIIGPLGGRNGRFCLSIQSMKSSEETRYLPRYTFDGPCRFSRHNSFSIGRLTMLNADCIYSTWKIQMRRISVFFDPQHRQHWNKKYKAAQSIFGVHPFALASRSAIKLGHKVLYGRTLKHNENGQLTSADDLWKSVFSDGTAHPVKPCVYTYIIDDNTWRFSETDIQFFTDFASKHALLANCCEHVRYAGEFHPRPKYGWDRWDDEWELVFDNASGTYSPSADLLINLKELLLFNFPGLNVVTYDHKDPRLKESMEQLKDAVKKYKNSTTTIQELVMMPSTPV